MKKHITCIFAALFVSFSAFADGVDTTKFKLFMKLTGHMQSVEAVAWSQNGKWMASGGWDYDVHVYKADTPNFGNEKYIFHGHMGGITSLVFSKDGKFLASASKDFSIRVYNLEKGELVFSANDQKAAVSRVIIDPKSKYVMCSSLDGTLMMYEFQNPVAKPKMIKYSGPVNSFVPAIDGRSMYVVTDKGEIDNIDFKAAVLRSFKGHTGKVNCLELSPNGKMLASGSDDKSILIWDLTTGKLLKTLKGHEWNVTSVAWTIDGNYLSSTCNDGNTIIWDLAAGKAIKTLKSMGNNARGAVWSPDMGYLMVATLMDASNNGAVLYNTPLKKLPPPPPVKPGAKTTPKPGTTPPSKPSTPGTKPATPGTKPATTGTAGSTPKR